MLPNKAGKETIFLHPPGTMSTEMESLDEKVLSVRAAIGKISYTTVNTLKDVLLTNNCKSGTKPSKDVAAFTSNSRAHPTKSRSGTFASKKTPKEIDEQLPLKEKLILSTEIINAALKSLTEAIKTQTRARTTRRTSNDQIKASSRNDLRGLSSFSDSSVISRSPSRKTSSTGISITESRSTSLSSGESILRPTAESARVAFACLRVLQSSHIPDVKLPCLQLENGMSVLISKLLTLGMNDLAAKELKILKRCLVSDLVNKKESTKNNSRSLLTGYDPLDLLDFGNANFLGAKLELVITTQIQILRLLSHSKNSDQIESVVPIFRSSNLSSPMRLILIAAENAREPKIKDKIVKQLGGLSEILLSLCPSISLSYDAFAIEPILSVSPETAFQLQSIALNCRFLFWRLNGHKGDIVRDIFEPFRRCLSTFIRRSQCSKSERFSVGIEASKVVENLENNNSIPYSRGLGLVLVEIYKALATIAKDALHINVAIKWTNEAYVACKKENISDARLYIVTARLVSLRLQSLSREPVEEENLLSLLQYLESPFKGEPSEIQELLVEVSNARRAALGLFIQRRKLFENLTNVNDGLQDMCGSLVFLCPQIFLRYLGHVPKSVSTPKDKERYEKKRQFINKLSSHVLDSALFMTKIYLAQGNQTFDSLDSRLQDCLSLLNQTNLGSEEKSQHDLSNCQMPSYHVRISNIYYTLFLNIRDDQNNAKNNESIRILRRSLQCLQDRPLYERQTALFTTKLERLAELYKNHKRYDELLKTLCNLRDEIIEGGLLSKISERASHKSLNTTWSESREAAMLSRTIHSILKIQLKTKKFVAQISLCEDSWSNEERAIILEHELEILSRKSFPTSRLTNDVQILIFKKLFVLYDRLNYPIRRIRVALKLLSTNCGIFCKELKEVELELDPFEITSSNIKGTEDENLLPYFTHYKSMIMVSKELDSSQPRLDKIKEGLATWCDIACSCQDFSILGTQIDDVVGLLAFLHIVADWLYVHGHGEARVVALRLIINLSEKCDPIINSDELILSLTVLGTQWLQLGYSGKAGLVLDRALALNEKCGGSLLVRLQLYVSFCEYLVITRNLNDMSVTYTKFW